MRTESAEVDDVALACLIQLAASAEELHRSITTFLQRGGASGGSLPGGPYSQLLAVERRLEMVERISSAVKDLTRDGQRFRRAEARALYAEGLTMAQLAVVFGVSRQRVSTLLHGADDHAPGEPDAVTINGNTA